MLAGHFAIGLAIKARRPEIPALPIMIGVGIIDIVSGFFLLAGLDRVTPNLSRGPYLFYDLTYIDWDHSLLMAMVWSLLWGAVFIKNKPVAIVAALAAFSHFVADWPFHNHDLALYPWADLHFGAGLWASLGTTSWVIEGVFSALLAVYFWHTNSRRGIRSHWPCLVLLLFFLGNSPWLSPMKFGATWSDRVIPALLVTTTFLGLGILFSWLITIAEADAIRPRAADAVQRHRS
jgi:hypothetical protein